MLFPRGGEPFGYFEFAKIPLIPPGPGGRRALQQPALTQTLTVLLPPSHGVVGTQPLRASQCMLLFSVCMGHFWVSQLGPLEGKVSECQAAPRGCLYMNLLLPHPLPRTKKFLSGVLQEFQQRGLKLPDYSTH